MTQEALTKRIEEYLSAGGLFNPELANHVAVRDLLIECREALRENAMREVQRLGQEIEQEPVADAYTFAEMRFVVCPNCGNKRCPKANDHRNACTNSNEVGQKGSSWEHVKPLAQPEQEPVAYLVLFEGAGKLLEFKKGNYIHGAKVEHIPLYAKPQIEVGCAECGVNGGHALYCVACAEKFVGGYKDSGVLAVETGLEQVSPDTPPQRTWAGLTNEEIENLMDVYDVASPDYARAIEAKLKEKNKG
jgi:hypothetical protein